MFNVICLAFAVLGLSFMIGDLIIVRKNRKMLNEIEKMREWCDKFNATPEDYIKELKIISAEIKKSTKEIKK